MPTIFSPLKIIPEKIAITAPKERSQDLENESRNEDTQGSEIKERIRKRYERERIKIEKLFTLGYTTSGDPWKIGTK